jgi:hypothetical protein
MNMVVSLKTAADEMILKSWLHLRHAGVLVCRLCLASSYYVEVYDTFQQTALHEGKGNYVEVYDMVQQTPTCARWTRMEPFDFDLACPRSREALFLMSLFNCTATDCHRTTKISVALHSLLHTADSL